MYGVGGGSDVGGNGGHGGVAMEGGVRKGLGTSGGTGSPAPTGGAHPTPAQLPVATTSTTMHTSPSYGKPALLIERPATATPAAGVGNGDGSSSRQPTTAVPARPAAGVGGGNGVGNTTTTGRTPVIQYEAYPTPALPFEFDEPWWAFLVRYSNVSMTLTALLWWGCCLATHFVCTRISYHRGVVLHNMVGTPPLHDLLHEILPNTQSIRVVPEIGHVLPVLYLSGLMLYHFDQRSLDCFRTFLVSHGLLLLLRGISFLGTTLPDASQQCHVSLFVGSCHDLIFSGHVMLMILCILLIQHFFHVPPVLRVGIGLDAAVVTYFVISSRNHYTVDVVLALVVTYFVYMAFTRHPFFVALVVETPVNVLSMPHLWDSGQRGGRCGCTRHGPTALTREGYPLLVDAVGMKRLTDHAHAALRLMGLRPRVVMVKRTGAGSNGSNGSPLINPIGAAPSSPLTAAHGAWDDASATTATLPGPRLPMPTQGRMHHGRLGHDAHGSAFSQGWVEYPSGMVAPATWQQPGWRPSPASHAHMHGGGSAWHHTHRHSLASSGAFNPSPPPLNPSNASRAMSTGVYLPPGGGGGGTIASLHSVPTPAAHVGGPGGHSLRHRRSGGSGHAGRLARSSLSSGGGAEEAGEGGSHRRPGPLNRLTTITSGGEEGDELEQGVEGDGGGAPWTTASSASRRHRRHVHAHREASTSATGSTVTPSTPPSRTPGSASRGLRTDGTGGSGVAAPPAAGSLATGTSTTTTATTTAGVGEGQDGPGYGEGEGRGEWSSASTGVAGGLEDELEGGVAATSHAHHHHDHRGSGGREWHRGGEEGHGTAWGRGRRAHSSMDASEYAQLMAAAAAAAAAANVGDGSGGRPYWSMRDGAPHTHGAYHHHHHGHDLSSPTDGPGGWVYDGHGWGRVGPGGEWEYESESEGVPPMGAVVTTNRQHIAREVSAAMARLRAWLARGLQLRGEGGGVGGGGAGSDVDSGVAGDRDGSSGGDGVDKGGAHRRRRRRKGKGGGGSSRRVEEGVVSSPTTSTGSDTDNEQGGPRR